MGAGRGGGFPWSSTQGVGQANPSRMGPRCDDGGLMARYPVIPAAEKSFGVRLKAARTPNRHWWSGREYQSDRANPGQGTRQITPVPSV